MNTLQSDIPKKLDIPLEECDKNGQFRRGCACSLSATLTQLCLARLR